MLTKVLLYPMEALKKPVYLCAEIFDRKEKTKETNDGTIKAASFANKEDFIEFFINKACDFAINNNPDIEIIHPPSSNEDEDNYHTQHFKSKWAPISVDKKIRQYLFISCVPLDFWQSHQTNWPVFTCMARCILEVLALSGPSEWYFLSAQSKIGSV